MVDCTIIGGFPGKFVNILMEERLYLLLHSSCSDKNQPAFPNCINTATAMLFHGIFTVAVVQTKFNIDISHYQKHNMLRDSSGSVA